MIRKAGIEDIPAIRKMADVAFRRTYASILWSYLLPRWWKRLRLLPLWKAARWRNQAFPSWKTLHPARIPANRPGPSTLQQGCGERKTDCRRPRPHWTQREQIQQRSELLRTPGHAQSQDRRLPHRPRLLHERLHHGNGHVGWSGDAASAIPFSSTYHQNWFCNTIVWIAEIFSYICIDSILQLITCYKTLLDVYLSDTNLAIWITKEDKATWTSTCDGNPVPRPSDVGLTVYHPRRGLLSCLSFCEGSQGLCLG